MLVRVLARSRPECQLVENKDGPNGLDPPKKPVRWGIEPARRRDTPVGLPAPGAAEAAPAVAAGAAFGVESIPDTPGGRKGLVEGVGREDCEMGCGGGFKSVRRLPTGEKREGTVPALARREELCKPVLGGGMRSGNPSWLGDSGMFSRSGVEWPLVGGPQILGEMPSSAWISRALEDRKKDNRSETERHNKNTHGGCCGGVDVVEQPTENTKKGHLPLGVQTSPEIV